MERQQFSKIVVLLVLILFALINIAVDIYAQGGSGALPAPKPTPTPARKGSAKSSKPAAPVAPSAPAPPVITTLIFNQEVNGRLDPKGSEKTPNGSLYEEYALTAKSEEQLSFQLQSESPSLAIQILDKDETEIAVARDSSTGNYKIATPTGGLPSDGEYRVRVVGAASGRSAIPFVVMVHRHGLLQNAYYSRFEKIMLNYRESDPASVEETLAKLEELARDDGNKPGAFEFLGILYLSHRRDVAKAEQAMEQALKTNGAAVIKISYDSQWRRLAKSKSGLFDWPDPRTGWLRIRPGQLMLADPNNKPLVTLGGLQIKELTKVVTNNNALVIITTPVTRRPFVFLPDIKEQAGADLAIKLIETHVKGKVN